ncbi:TPA: oligosaccharide flippase family protein, partial [Escherichia coli]|nr:oligosaccharide flippase family protein [Escherichia coli]
ILGSYNLAYRIMLFPLQSLTFVASRSLYPVLSHYQDNILKVRNTYLNCVFVILLLTAPLMSGLAIYSKPFVFLIFGPQWHITADVLQWLAPTAIIQSILSTTGSVFMAKGRTDTLMRLGIIGTFLQVSAFLIGVHFSITTFAFCYLIANILNFFPVMVCLLKLISVSFYSFFKKIFSIIMSTLIMIAVLKTIDLLVFPIADIKNLFTLVFFSLAGAVVYFFAIFSLSTQFRKTVLFFYYNKIGNKTT